MNKTDENWALIYSTSDEVRSELIIQSLEEAGIKAVKMNKRDSNYLIGNIEVYVRLEDMGAAKTIVKEFEK